ncbi:hypothetical protein EDB86DRAFT_677687 [Lactarius hatsudake]|nr:hypothetical protein EDB86DRAFT_677687 [Lactarius hatsudake]
MWASSIFKMGRSVRYFRINLTLNRTSRPHYLWHACVQPEYHLSNSAFGTIRYKSQCRFRQHRIVHAPTLIMGPDCCFRGSSCRCTLTSSSGVTMKFAISPVFSSAASIVSFDGAVGLHEGFSDIFSSHSQMSPTTSKVPGLHIADIGAKHATFLGFSEGKKFQEAGAQNLMIHS